MRTRSKLVLAALAATLLLSIGASNASARNLSIDEQFFSVTWTSLEFVTVESRITRILCPVTLQGSFHSRTIEKVSGRLLGYITSAIVNNMACRNGHATFLRETLPWHITYEGFGGILPEITSIMLLLVRPAFRLEPGASVTCLSQPENILATMTLIREAGGVRKTDRLEVDPEQSVACGELFVWQYLGRGEVMRSRSSTRILVTLI